MARTKQQITQRFNSQSNKSRHLYRPSILALRDIRRFRNSPALIIKRHPFQRLVYEIANSIQPGFRFQIAAITSLREAAEAYVVSLFVNRNRIKITRKGIQLARRLRGENMI